MRQLEKNVIQSFQMAKHDISDMQIRIAGLSQAQEHIVELIDKLNAHETMLYERLKEISMRGAQKIDKPVIVTQAKIPTLAVSKKTTEFVATKGGKNFHTENCPFAQNIKPKNKVRFKSRTKALNQGFKACNCVK